MSASGSLLVWAGLRGAHDPINAIDSGTQPVLFSRSTKIVALLCFTSLPRSIAQAKHVVKFVVWWVGLGTVSSVGLGCGFQTGVLFLFPHIMKVRVREVKIPTRPSHLVTINDLCFSRTILKATETEQTRSSLPVV